MPIDARIPLGATMAQVASPLEIAQLLQENRRRNDAADALAEERRGNAAVRQVTLAEAATRQQAQAETTQQNRTLDELMKTALVEDPTTGVSSFNRSALEQGILKANLGHRMPMLTQTLDAMDESAKTRQAESRKQIALAIRGAELAGGTYEAALGSLAYLRKNGTLAEGAAQPVLEALEADPSPEGVQRVLQGFGGRLPEYQALVEAQATKRTTAAQAAATLKKTEAEAAKLQAEAVNGPKKSYRPETMLVNGRPAPTVFDPDTARYLLGGVDVTDKVQPVPPRGHAPPALKEITTIGPNGERVTKFVQAQAGDTYPAPPAAARAPTGQERQALAFYNRMQQAVDTIAPTGAAPASTLEGRMAALGAMGQQQLAHAPNMLQTAEQQQYLQAQRAFTEARLRKESGAAIPEHEFEQDRRTYFVQPGDSPAVVAQKQAARAQVLGGLAFASGKAYDEYYGEPAPTARRPAGTQTVVPPGGAQPGPTRPPITIKGAVPGDTPAAPDYGYGNRYNSTTPKGLGFLGPLQRADGGVMSEFSIGVGLGGKETEIPTLVPTLTKAEVQTILSLPEGQKLPPAIVDKAVAYARERMKAGKDPFAGPGEQQNLYPELKRAPVSAIRGGAPAAGGPLTVGGFTVTVK